MRTGRIPLFDEARERHLSVIPGETFLGFDLGDHLWIVLANAENDEVALVSLTTHGRSRCSGDCVVLAPAEHPWIRHDSCVYYRGAGLFDARPLEMARSHGALDLRGPLPGAVLRRIQLGALSSRFTSPLVKSVVRAEIQSA